MSKTDLEFATVTNENISQINEAAVDLAFSQVKLCLFTLNSSIKPEKKTFGYKRKLSMHYFI